MSDSNSLPILLLFQVRECPDLYRKLMGCGRWQFEEKMNLVGRFNLGLLRPFYNYQFLKLLIGEPPQMRCRIFSFRTLLLVGSWYDSYLVDFLVVVCIGPNSFDPTAAKINIYSEREILNFSVGLSCRLIGFYDSACVGCLLFYFMEFSVLLWIQPKHTCWQFIC